MPQETFLVAHDTRLADEFVKNIQHPPRQPKTVGSVSDLPRKLNEDSVVVVCLPDASRLDRTWLRSVAAQGRVLIVAHQCGEETWRRLILNGAVDVLRPPFHELDFEDITTDHRAVERLFRRQVHTVQRGVIRFEYELPNDEKHVAGMVHLIATLAMEFGFDSNDYLMSLPLALDEAITNAIVHGNKRNGNAKVRIEGWVKSEELRVRISDEGEGFRRENQRDPVAPENLLSPGGRGVFLIESVMDEVKWLDNGRCIEIVKRRKRDST